MAAIDPEIFRLFGFWSSILVLKLVAMAPMTARYRLQKRIFANPEDAATLPKGKVSLQDPDIERVRRAHLNDLENILPWFIITYVWLTTNPSPWLAGMLIRSFVLARITHTLVYAIFPQQPARAISFFVGYGIVVYEALASLLHYL